MNRLETAVHEALCMHDGDNVDIYVKDDGSIDIMWHSRYNSFCISENVCRFDNLSEDDIDEIIKIADSYGVGYVF